MSIGLLFWILMVLRLILGGYSLKWPGCPPWAGVGLDFLLFFLLGWHSFGFIIHQ